VCVVVPEVPVMVRLGVDVVEAPDALSVNCATCPGERLAVIGEAVTPAGSPLNVTVTALLKLPTAPIETASDWLPPSFLNVTAFGVAARLKSGGVDEPHPMSNDKSNNGSESRAIFTVRFSAGK
jgi:hypothetical protein